MLYSVRCLLELPDLSDDVGNLKEVKPINVAVAHSWHVHHAVYIRVSVKPTILILEKLTRPSSVKFGVPSSIKAKSVRYIPRYGTQGGLQLKE